MTEERNSTDDQPAAGAEVADAKESDSSLNSLLNEFENGTAKPKASSSEIKDEAFKSEVSGLTKKLNGLMPVVDFAKQAMADRQEETLNQDLASALKVLKEPEETKDIPDSLVRGFMEAYAVENKPFATAFQKRHDDPAGWKTALESGREWLKEKVKLLPGNKVKDDLEAARAAVAETNAEPTGDDDEGPSAVDMFNMSDAEFRSHKDNLRAS